MQEFHMGRARRLIAAISFDVTKSLLGNIPAWT